MSKRILWIEDDYYNYQSLMRPLMNLGVSIDYALSGFEGYERCKNWKKYNLIVVDVILPLSKDTNVLPPEVKAWGNEPYVGIGLVRWIKTKLKATCPIIILSVMDDLETKYDLGNLGINDYISKRGLLPSNILEKFKPYLIEKD